jgi:hypothetical protein
MKFYEAGTNLASAAPGSAQGFLIGSDIQRWHIGDREDGTGGEDGEEPG